MASLLAIFCRVGTLAILAFGTALAVRETRREWVVTLSSMAVERGDSTAALPPGLAQSDAPPRAVLNGALVTARTAAMDGDAAEREVQLNRAQDLLNSALKARPRWGEAWVVAAYIALLKHGPYDPRTRAAYSRSLAEAPYLRDSSDWRIRYGAKQWFALDQRTRARMLNEAMWIARNARTDARRVEAIIGTGAAGKALRRMLDR